MIGTCLNQRYRLDAELGHGGLGVIYRAHDLVLDREVAVKVLNRGGLGSQGRSRLLNEARAVARLNHPNIVSVYDAGEDASINVDGAPLPYIVMELIEGESLHVQRPRTVDEACRIMREVCLALDHAHRAGIIHRDLKPENVLLTPEGVTKLSDFGLARSLASRLTQEGALVGTVYYMAPEIALGQPVDLRTDLYSLGVMFYELVAGRLPFLADEPLAIISQHLYAPLVPPSSHNPDVPPALDALIARLMSKRPEDRPASADETRQALDDLRRSTGQVKVSPAQPIERLARGKLVGREREFNQIKELWRQVVTGGGGPNVLLMSGDSGVGKTPLVRETRALVEVSGGRVLAGESFGENNPSYSPMAQMVRDAISRYAPDLPAFACDDLSCLAPEITNRLAAAQAAPPGEVTIDAQRLYESMMALLVALASRPLLLVLEDAQWADEGTLFMLRHLARRSRAAGLRVLFLVTFQELAQGSASPLQRVTLDLNRERLATWIALAPFDRGQTREFLASLFQAEVPAPFVDSIYAITEGNMFYIEEMCKTLVEAGQVVAEQGQWSVPAGVEQSHLPQSIRLTVLERVARLSQGAQDLLRLAAVIGREFDEQTLARAAELSEDDLLTYLEEALKAQLIYEARSREPSAGAAQTRYLFAHNLIPTILLAEMSSIRLRRLHRKVAAVIAGLAPDNDEALAYHYERAGDEAQAQAYAVKAGDHALRLYANDRAAQFYQAALAHPLPAEQRARVLAGLGEVHLRRSFYDKAGSAWQEAIELYRSQGNLSQVAYLFARSARAAWYSNSPARSLEICRAGLSGLQATNAFPHITADPGVVMLLHETARALRFNNLNEDALELVRKALALAEENGLVEAQAEALATLSIIPGLEPEEAIGAAQKALDLSEANRFFSTAFRALDNLSDLNRNQGHYHAARDLHLRAREVCQRIGNAGWEYFQLAKAGEQSVALGENEVADGILDQLIELEPLVRAPYVIAQRHMIMARLAHMRGDWETGLRELQGAAGICRQDGHSLQVAEINIYTAMLQLDLGDLNGAQAALDEVEPLIEHDLSISRVIASGWLAHLHLLQGRLDAARQQFERMRSRVIGRPWAVDALVLRWIELSLSAAGGDWEAARLAYPALLDDSAAMRLPWEHGYLLRDWARQCRLHGDPSQANELLAQALAVYERYAMPRHVELVARLLI